MPRSTTTPKTSRSPGFLEQAFQRARELLATGDLEADNTVQAWLQTPQAPLTLSTYLAGDDIVFTYHLQRWQGSNDPLLADLCRRVVNRDLLKTLEVTRLSETEQTVLLGDVRTYLEDQGYSSQHYCALRHIWSRGYTTYQQGIELFSDNIFVDIKQISPIVQTLSQSYQRILVALPQRNSPLAPATLAKLPLKLPLQQGGSGTVIVYIELLQTAVSIIDSELAPQKAGIRSRAQVSQRLFRKNGPAAFAHSGAGGASGKFLENRRGRGCPS